MVEVAIVADLCTVDEAHDFLEEVPEKLDFMATSCCPAWSMMAKTAFPGLAKNISMTMTPMVFTARMMKQADPEQSAFMSNIHMLKDDPNFEV